MGFGNYSGKDRRVWSCELGQISCGVSDAILCSPLDELERIGGVW